MLEVSQLSGFNASAGSDPVAQYVTRDFQIRNSSTHNHPGIALGEPSADRLVACIVTGYGATARQVTGATIAGVAATVVTARNSGYAPAIIAARVPDGASGDIVITYSGSYQESHIAVYALRGLSGFDAISAGNNGVTSSGASSVSLTGVSRAIVIAGGNHFQDGSNPWSAGGIVNDFSGPYNAGSIYFSCGRVVPDAGNLAITMDTSSAHAFAAAAWR
jgi:hypothetical protein